MDVNLNQEDSPVPTNFGNLKMDATKKENIKLRKEIETLQFLLKQQQGKAMPTPLSASNSPLAQNRAQKEPAQEEEILPETSRPPRWQKAGRSKREGYCGDPYIRGRGRGGSIFNFFC
ncbi:uncharacterized protein LOC112588292 [Harpegnathos saltator]|uniref:uncharacterized protein LOC112588292 n=1 Tax=Harpegnathos saltator TaxID=610380 RepID=UPI000DBEE049|nr:uncharacterized protein LOC112588292 [Harpegnathos saltator]